MRTYPVLTTLLLLVHWCNAGPVSYGTMNSLILSLQNVYTIKTNDGKQVPLTPQGLQLLILAKQRLIMLKGRQLNAREVSW